MRLLVAFILGIILLAACTNTDRAPQDGVTDAQEDTSAVTDPAPPTAPVPEKQAIVLDSLSVPAFEIKLNLSKKAEEQLARQQETVIVSADFSGTPKDTTSAAYREYGEMYIGSASVELRADRIAVFNRAKIARRDYEALADKNFRVLINVYSGRRASPDNILDVDILQKEINEVKGKTHTLKGKLIGG